MIAISGLILAVASMSLIKALDGSETLVMGVGTAFMVVTAAIVLISKALSLPRPRMVSDLKGKVALVTGASRGIGKGIAIGLGQAQATVYITGRSEKALKEAAAEVDAAGGKGIAVVCDHSNDGSIKKLFEKIAREQPGGLDILVHNAYAGVAAIFNSDKLKFWERGGEWWDTINNVGLRSHFITSQHAIPLMLKGADKDHPRLIVVVSSVAGSISLFDVAYGVGKAAKDKLAKDMAWQLEEHNIAAVSLWPGAVKTEYVQDSILSADQGASGSSLGSSSGAMFSRGETPLYSGFAVAALARDKKVMSLTGKTLITEDVGERYNFREADGTKPNNFRSIKSNLVHMPGVARFVPRWIKVPKWVLAVMFNKF
mmetsp:Transcript_43160/g.84384  ORF Transcript_43160/g.84384 Transcript_43160/m.84384 type:complete len:371 (+) Transcript_43160:31-1143(+)